MLLMKKNLLVAQEQKLGARGHQVLQEPSPAGPKLEKEIYFLSLNRKNKHQNVVRTAVTHLALPCVPHFDVVYDLLLNRPTAVWNLFVNPSTPRPNLQFSSLSTIQFL